ncbi:sensor histidine kinase [Phaeodactylibacter luteus]|uniref:histidine kinase n=1 Tax=Phaeodactylibacter luteus TaxID=1564516 RepID=A0A5C6RSI0_9BACT|nr:ATP-binding protein [Phaeodactylibacter luteus]TXB64904.1 sensor histidine kinase [Phaeodactylibacter luteus]
MLKNPTPQHIAQVVALYITGSAVIVWLGIEWLRTMVLFPWGVATIVMCIAIFTAAYFTTIYYLRKYIYRKIKLIYKTIHKHKLTSQEKTKQIDVTVNIIDEMEKQVAEWAEKQQEELDKYKAWAEYRRNFVGDISHELKTPIFNIQGYLHTLLDGALEDEQVNRTFLTKAAKNLERLHTIVEDLEAISRLESGALMLEIQTFDIRELTEEVFEDLEFKAEQRNIRLELKDGAAQGFKVQADRESIRQVLTNLVHNSIKYGKENGRTRVGFYDMDSNILIEIADNGLGIPKKHINHVFDRFYRVDKSRSRERGGSGLGLSIVKHIIEAHKQTINVRSAPQLGSTFGFTLKKSKGD